MEHRAHTDANLVIDHKMLTTQKTQRERERDEHEKASDKTSTSKFEGLVVHPELPQWLKDS